MKQTAVEWLIQQIKMLGAAAYTPDEAVDILGNKAKEMERQQIIKAVYHNCNAMSHSDLDCGEEYYSNQFK
jgi:hypothetical protein